MIPMVSELSEILTVKSLIDRECELALRRGTAIPEKIHFGIMVEVPSLLFDLDGVIPHVDFVSVGTNDLMQYFYAADRSNSHVSGRFDPLSPPFLRVLRSVVEAAARHDVPATICGEIGGRPLEAMALIGLGYRSLSMAPANVGPVKAMVMSLDASRIASHITTLIDKGGGSLRDELLRYAENEGVEL